ncbi:PDZ domain-containing protein [Paraflavitalea soli]|uniref:PDZ domain-containing protein n=1 Tax=Paraflavitalea soli TaxID=2315862 RepID=A0A3B7MH56_9BACT|nr:PDZ domain-containing protein [Paraflavitalea soli]AXY72917.1 PDZ domain-containing protein [Paraflavitalea soli]
MMRILLFILMLVANTAFAKELYVSVKGNDKNPGTKALPFATLERAKLEARKYKKEEVVVYIMQGTWYLSQPLVFRGIDSRNDYASLYFMALPGHRPVIKGSRKLTLNFKPYQNGILQAALPASFPEMDQLYVNGVLQVMVRYPNYQEHTLPLHGTAQDALSAARIRSWANPTGGYIHALHSGEWGGMHYRITGKNTDSTLRMEGGWQNNRPSPMHKNYRYVENILEELDTTGEWYADRVKNILYYKPAAGVDMSKTTIEVPVLENLVSFKGLPGHYLTNIAISGIRFEHTLRTFMKNKEPLLRSDWTIYRSGAIDLEYTRDCAINACELFSLGGNAVFFSNYNKDAMVTGCHIAQIGGNAISFVGNPKAVRSPSFRYEEYVPYMQMDKMPGPIGDDFPTGCLVFDNLIHDIGLVEKQVAGVQLSMCQQIRIVQNTIYNVPRAGINISEGTWGGHEIAYNDVFNTVQETGDHGAFNSWGRDRYWHPNRAVMDSLMAVHPDLWKLDAVLPTNIHHNRFRCDNGWDIDLDDGSSNYHIYNNICLNGGLKLREGYHRKVENNIILNNSFHPHVWFRSSLDTFQHNIVSGPYLPIRIPDWGPGVDSNFFPDEAALHTTQQWGIDAHSAAGDPLFIGPAAGNYEVSDRSAAKAVGFHPFDIEVGVQSDRLRKLAANPPLPVLIKASADASATYTFLDMKVKNLNTLAERSATGMDKETGVLVLEVPDNAPWHKLVQPNDVILELAGVPVNNIQDLLNARMKVQWHAAAVVVIFRNQKRQEIKGPLK